MKGGLWLAYWLLYFVPIIVTTWRAARLQRNPAFWCLMAVLFGPFALVALVIVESTSDGVIRDPGDTATVTTPSTTTLWVWLGVSGIVAITLTVVTLLPGRSLYIADLNPARTGFPSPEQSAIDRVRRHTRGDGHRLDAWLDARASRTCRSLKSATPRWYIGEARLGGHDPGYRVGYDYGSTEGCPDAVLNDGRFAEVDARTGMVSNAIDRDPPPPYRSWFGDFEAGDPP